MRDEENREFVTASLRNVKVTVWVVVCVLAALLNPEGVAPLEARGRQLFGWSHPLRRPTIC